MGLKIRGWKSKIPLQRQNDRGIIETMINSGIGNPAISTINTCRIFLRAITTSDIADGGGTQLCPMAIRGVRDAGRTSIYKWKKVKKPNLNAWLYWEQHIKKVYCDNEKSSSLTLKLGNWIQEADHEWFWYFHPVKKTLYHIKQHVVHVFRASSRRSMELRENVKLFKAYGVIQVEQIPPGTCRASAEYESNNNYVYAKFYGYSRSMQSEKKKDEGTLLSKFSPNQKWMIMSSNLGAIKKKTLDDMMSQNMILVSDGSHKDEDSSMAAILESADQTKQIIISGPVPSNFTSPSHCTDSYRSEMAGLLAGLTLFRYMEQITNMSTHITISCDNDAALDVGTIFSYFSANMKHYDMARSLINARFSLTSSTAPMRVKGHADTQRKQRVPPTRQELLNQSCDRIAKKARETFAACGPVELANEGLTVWHKNEKICHDFKAHLHHIFFSKKAKEKLSEKYEWKNGEFDKIDWKANKRALGMLSNPTKIWIAKFIAKFLPIGRNMQRIGRWSQSHCPRCMMCEETHRHLLECQHEESKEKLIEGIGKLRDWLNKMSTPQQLENQIISKINAELDLPHVRYISSHPLITSQTIIGEWSHFMEGRIHRDFRKYFDNHYSQIRDKKTGEMWVSGMIQKMWTTIYRPIWEIRNKCVHRKSNALNQTREREDLKARVQKAYVNENQDNFLSQDRHLFSKPLKYLLKSSNMALKAWLFTLQIAKEAQRKAIELDKEDSLQTLHPWLIPKASRINRSKTKIKKKRRVSTKVRRRIQHSYVRMSRKRRIRPNSRRQLAPSYVRMLSPSKFQCNKQRGPSHKEFLRRTGSYRPP